MARLIDADELIRIAGEAHSTKLAMEKAGIGTMAALTFAVQDAGFSTLVQIAETIPTIDPNNLFFTVGKRADYLEKLYTKIQAVTRLTPERLLELFMEGYTLQAPDHRKELEEMQRIAWMDLPGQNGGQDR